MARVFENAAHFNGFYLMLFSLVSNADVCSSVGVQARLSFCLWHRHEVPKFNTFAHISLLLHNIYKTTAYWWYCDAVSSSLKT